MRGNLLDICKVTCTGGTAKSNCYESVRVSIIKVYVWVYIFFKLSAQGRVKEKR